MAGIIIGESVCAGNHLNGHSHNDAHGRCQSLLFARPLGLVPGWKTGFARRNTPNFVGYLRGRPLDSGRARIKPFEKNSQRAAPIKLDFYEQIHSGFGQIRTTPLSAMVGIWDSYAIGGASTAVLATNR
jgi:hypothetical protein